MKKQQQKALPRRSSFREVDMYEDYEPYMHSQSPGGSTGSWKGGNYYRSSTKDVFLSFNDKIFPTSSYIYASDLTELKALLGVIEEDEDKIVLDGSKLKEISVQTRVPNVLLCAYDSTKAYLSNMFGVTLCSDDERWYKCHPKTISSGLPINDLISVLNDLVKPYKIGISNVYYPKGNSLSADALGWLEALGCNPMGKMDRSTSNEEYLAQFEGSPEDVITQIKEELKKCNFEFVDFPPKPVVFCGTGGYGSLGPGGGHATYRSFRAQPISAGFGAAVAFDRIENIHYHCEPPTFDLEYEEHLLQQVDILESKIGATKIKELIKKPSYPSSYPSPSAYSTGSSRSSDLPTKYVPQIVSDAAPHIEALALELLGLAEIFEQAGCTPKDIEEMGTDQFLGILQEFSDVQAYITPTEDLSGISPFDLLYHLSFSEIEVSRYYSNHDPKISWRKQLAVWILAHALVLDGKELDSQSLAWPLGRVIACSLVDALDEESGDKVPHDSTYRIYSRYVMGTQDATRNLRPPVFPGTWKAEYSSKDMRDIVSYTFLVGASLREGHKELEEELKKEDNSDTFAPFVFMSTCVEYILTKKEITSLSEITMANLTWDFCSKYCRHMIGTKTDNVITRCRLLEEMIEAVKGALTWTKPRYSLFPITEIQTKSQPVQTPGPLTDPKPSMTALLDMAEFCYNQGKVEDSVELLEGNFDRFGHIKQYFEALSDYRSALAKKKDKQEESEFGPLLPPYM